jgi:hypothetical protein
MARSSFGTHSKRDEETGTRVAPEQVAAAAQRASIFRQNSPLAPRLGANARVLLDEPVANVERLLAVGAPTPAAATRSMPSPARGTEKAPFAVSKSSTPHVTRLLAAAVERAGASNVSMSPTPEPLRGGNVPAPAGDAEHVRGFRGLAQRALKPTNGAHHVHVQRIEPETRVSSDLAFDTLDDKVADSLARVLEREARRHGIDLAEARS